MDTHKYARINRRVDMRCVHIYTQIQTHTHTYKGRKVVQQTECAHARSLGVELISVITFFCFKGNFWWGSGRVEIVSSAVRKKAYSSPTSNTPRQSIYPHRHSHIYVMNRLFEQTSATLESHLTLIRIPFFCQLLHHTSADKLLDTASPQCYLQHRDADQYCSRAPFV